MTGGCRSKVAGGLDRMGPPDFDGVVGDPFVEAAQHGSHRDGVVRDAQHHSQACGQVIQARCRIDRRSAPTPTVPPGVFHHATMPFIS